MQFYGKDNFQIIKDSIKTFIRTFNVSSDLTRVGVIVYSTNATVVFKMDNYTTQSDVEQAIDNIRYPAGGTYTGKALTKASENLFDPSSARPGNVSKILVVLTDGVSTDDVTQPAALLKNINVVPYVVGIGSNYDLSQLEQIAVNATDLVFRTEFNTISETFNRLRGKICQGIYLLHNVCCIMRFLGLHISIFLFLFYLQIWISVRIILVGLVVFAKIMV